MTYLIARLVVLLLLAAVFGFLLGRWWVRRSFVDVTESYETIASAASDAPWKQLWAKFDELDSRVSQIVQHEVKSIPQPNIPRVDIEPLRLGIAALETHIENLPQPKEPAAIDFGPTNRRIEQIEAAIANLPQPEKPAAIDFGPTNRRIEQLEAAIGNLPQPEKPAAIDFGPTNRRIEQLEVAIANLPKPKEPAAIDFGPTNRRIEKIEAAIANLPKPEIPAAVDFGPTNRRIEKIEAAIANLPQPEKPAAIDFGPTNRRIEQLEAAIANLPKPEIPTEEFGAVINKLQLIDARVSRLAKPSKPKREGPRLLSSASHGHKDDLKRISGVGPKLEKLLNKNGVYYFWQVAEWRKRDVKTMDDRLDAFRGRILRDDWVRQAASLVKTLPNAAQRPAE